MFTPQEVHERTFVKAIFGVYDMESVDEFLEPLVMITSHSIKKILCSKAR